MPCGKVRKIIIKFPDPKGKKRPPIEDRSLTD